MIYTGDLVRVVEAPDRDKVVMKHLFGKIGLIINRLDVSYSGNLWQVLIIDSQKVVYLNKFYLEKIQ